MKLCGWEGWRLSAILEPKTMTHRSFHHDMSNEDGLLFVTADVLRVAGQRLGRSFAKFSTRGNPG